MQRWLVLLLLLCIPLQFSLAAVSAYCGPEAGSAVAHEKDHQHQHEADGAASSDGGDAKAIGHIDIDPAHCHSGGATAILGSVHLAPLSTSSGADRIAYVMRALSPPASLPA